MEAVIGIVWRTLILNPSTGLNFYISQFFGVAPTDFLGQYSLQTVMALIIWQWTPFFFLIIIAGLQNIPEDIVDSSKIDGANTFQRLIFIDIPVIKDHIITAMMLGLINILKVFGLVYVTTQGGPGVSSANLPYLTYRTIFYDWSVGEAAATAVITVAITLFVTQMFYKRLKKGDLT